MAVAARPGTSDARVPCPLCGGLIHPIAGRCKHCKADLTSYHSARPAASTPLPALHVGQAVAQAVSTSAGLVGPVVAAPREAAQPVLPPRPAARGYPAEPKTAAWRSWPVLVIVVALLAIAGALAAMAWPAGAPRADGKAKRSLPPPPAPERMQTDPQIKPPVPRRSAQPDVAPPAAPAQPDPAARGAANEPDDRDDTGHDLDPSDDPLGAPSPTGNLSPAGNAIRFAMMSRVCTKLAHCGGSDDVGVQGMCEALAAQQIEPPACPAALRCLARIDTLPCGVQSNLLMHIQTLVNRLPDCADAARC